ncbi:MAG: zinc-ribbon domain-containing protein [Deltaproteobacteria bacterium]|nr:zinc-ribbon domain-containing protein [Deltaproteobacteria bacterium]
MQISCGKCGAAYTVDATQIPPQGMTMKCTRCLNPIRVKGIAPPPGDSVDEAWDLADPDFGDPDFGDLPGLPSPPAPPSAPRGAPTAAANFAGDDDLLDLPGLPSPPTPPSAPRGAPTAAANFAGDDDLLDLPGLPNPGSAKARGSAGNQDILDLPGLPSPAAGPSGLEELADLPMPKPAGSRGAAGGGRFAPPQQHTSDIIDLPAPIHSAPGIVDLPAPREGIVDLPRPVARPPMPPVDSDEMDYGARSLAEDDGPALSLDFDDPPLPPLGGAEYGNDALLDDVPGGTIDLPRPVLPRQQAGLLTPKPHEQAFIPLEEPDLLTPKEEPDFEPMTFTRPPTEGGVAPISELPLAPTATAAARSPRPAAPKQRRRPKALLPALIGVGVLVIAGITLGLVTDYGFFGIALLGGKKSPSGNNKAVPSTQASIAADSYAGYKAALAAAQAASAKAPKAIEPRATQAQLLAAITYRFADEGAAAQVQGLLAGLVDANDNESKKARALAKLAAHNAAAAASELKALSDQTEGDGLAALYWGWAALAANQTTAAKTAFSRATRADAKLIGAKYGLALAERKLAPKAAMTIATNASRQAPTHIGLLLLRAELLLDGQAPTQARKLAEQAAKLTETAHKNELAATQRMIALTELAAGQNNKALESLNKALKLNPDDPATLLTIGKMANAAGKHGDALDRLSKIGAGPYYRAARLEIARAQLATGELREAKIALQKLLQTEPTDGEARFLFGRCLEGTSRSEAIAQYERAIKDQPTYFPPYQRLSEIYVGAGKVHDALKVLGQARDKMSNSAGVLVAIGEVHLKQKDLAKAAQAFSEALIREPNDNQAMLALGRVQLAQDQLESAQKTLEALKARNADAQGLAGLLGALYIKQGKHQEAAAAYAQALRGESPTKQELTGATRAYLLAEKFRDAQELAISLVQKYPTDAQARVFLAEARMGMGQLGEALIEMQQALQRDRRASFLELQGKIYEKLNRVSDAIAAYGEALKLDDKLTDLRLRRAKLLVDNGAANDALTDAIQVLKVSPKSALAELIRGIALFDLRRETQAEKALKRALELDNTMSEAHWRLGQLYDDRRQLPLALDHFEKALIAVGDQTPSWLAQLHFRIGSVATKIKGKRQRAIDAYREFLKVARAGDALRDSAARALRDLGASP